MSDPQQSAAPRKARPVLRFWIESLLLTAGIVLLAFCGAAGVDRLLTTRSLLRALPAADHAPAPTSAHPVPALPGDAGSELSLRAAVSRPDAPLAILRIPKIHLEVPVLDGTDALTLNHAAGRIAGTALPGEPGNIGLAAHRDGFFRNLGRLRAGDTLTLETPAGTDIYTVDTTRIVSPADVSVLDPRPVPSLTLVTCYPFHYLGHAPQRYIVFASLAPQHHAPAGQ